MCDSDTQGTNQPHSLQFSQYLVVVISDADQTFQSLLLRKHIFKRASEVFQKRCRIKYAFRNVSIVSKCHCLNAWNISSIGERVINWETSKRSSSLCSCFVCSVPVYTFLKLLNQNKNNQQNVESSELHCWKQEPFHNLLYVHNIHILNTEELF